MKAAWQQAIEGDEIATFFMSRMEAADVVCDGAPNEVVTLLGARA
jgi:hypothetical protein